eukprot:TRINITY_DN67319_c1_g4_i2.p1 TRINITY_DN67319_c1_g4~~TRINITY_DN67319_c1_g4_i2.p1  ORF type:complete len:500 (-),score=94.85 TRINITY_DN67319_c1_g4_i2:134-1633(-)
MATYTCGHCGTAIEPCKSDIALCSQCLSTFHSSGCFSCGKKPAWDRETLRSWHGGTCPDCKKPKPISHRPQQQRSISPTRPKPNKPTAQTNNNSLLQHIHTLTSEKQTAENQVATLKQQLQHRNDTLNITKTKNTQLLNQVATLQQQLKDTQHKLNIATGQNTQLQVDLQDAKNEIGRLQLIEAQLLQQQQHQTTGEWSFENESGGYTNITDAHINNVLSDALKRFTADPTTNPIVTYNANNFTYAADVKKLEQRNCNTNTLRNLRAPGVVHVPPALRCRSDIPSFKTALSATMLTTIKKAPSDTTSVTQSLRDYAKSYQRGEGVLDDFELKCNTPGIGLPAAVVWLYTCDDWVYKDVNRILRAEDTSIIKLVSFIAALIEAIKVTPSDFVGEGVSPPTTLFRYMNVHPPELKKYQVGASFVWNSFTSTSCFDTQSQFGSTKFEIQFDNSTLKSTLFVEPFSAIKGEYEVLVPVGTFFEVVQNDTNNNLIKLKMSHCIF